MSQDLSQSIKSTKNKPISKHHQREEESNDQFKDRLDDQNALATVSVLRAMLQSTGFDGKLKSMKKQDLINRLSEFQFENGKHKEQSIEVIAEENSDAIEFSELLAQQEQSQVDESGSRSTRKRTRDQIEALAKTVVNETAAGLPESSQVDEAEKQNAAISALGKSEPSGGAKRALPAFLRDQELRIQNVIKRDRQPPTSLKTPPYSNKKDVSLNIKPSEPQTIEKIHDSKLLFGNKSVNLSPGDVANMFQDRQKIDKNLGFSDPKQILPVSTQHNGNQPQPYGRKKWPEATTEFKINNNTVPTPSHMFESQQIKFPDNQNNQSIIDQNNSLILEENDLEEEPLNDQKVEEEHHDWFEPAQSKESKRKQDIQDIINPLKKQKTLEEIENEHESERKNALLMKTMLLQNAQTKMAQELAKQSEQQDQEMLNQLGQMQASQTQQNNAEFNNHNGSAYQAQMQSFDHEEVNDTIHSLKQPEQITTQKQNDLFTAPKNNNDRRLSLPVTQQLVNQRVPQMVNQSVQQPDIQRMQNNNQNQQRASLPVNNIQMNRRDSVLSGTGSRRDKFNDLASYQQKQTNYNLIQQGETGAQQIQENDEKVKQQQENQPDTDEVRSKKVIMFSGLKFLLLAILITVGFMTFKPAKKQVFCPSFLEKMQNSKESEDQEWQPLEDVNWCGNDIDCAKFKDCLPCNTDGQGYCSQNGEMLCNEGFVFYNNTCVESTALKMQALNSLDHIEKIARGVLAKKLCGQSEHAGLLFEEVIVWLSEEYPDNYQEVTKKVRQIMEVHTIEGLTYDLPIFNVTEITALHPDFSVKCKAKMFLRDNIFWIIILTSVTTWTLFKLKAYRKRSRQAKFLNKFYNSLKQVLLSSNRTQSGGLTESDMLHKFLSETEGKNEMKLDEFTFRETVWPALEDMRKKDKQKILSTEKLEYGRSIKVWKIKN